MRRAEGSLPSLIAVQFARCLYDGVREVKPAAEFAALFLRHMRNPRSTPAANAVPSGEPARSVMQMTTHLPDCPCGRPCVFLGP